MPDIWMDVDANLAEVPVNIMPLLDDTDFKSRETAIAYNASGMDLVWNFVTTAGAMSQTAVTPTTGGNYDWAHQGDGMYSIEIPASGGASINNDTEGFGWFTGLVTGVLPWRGPIIGFRAAGLNNKLIDDAYSTTRGLAGTALPDAAADAAGSLPISDAGGLDLDSQIKTDIDAILVDTNELQTDLVNGGRLDLLVDAIKAKTDNLPTDPADDSDLDTAIAAIKTVVDDLHNTDLPAVKTETAAIKAKTDNLPADPADDSDIDTAIAAVKSVLDNIHDTDLPAVKAETAAIVADTNELQTDLVNGGRLDLLVDAIKAKTDNLPTDPADDSDIDTQLANIYSRIGAPAGASIAADIAGISAGSGASAEEVWEYEERTLTEGAAAEVDEEALGEAMWTYGSRTLTMTPAEIVAVAVEGTISQTRGNDWTITFTGLTFTGTNMQFALKSSNSQADAAAPLFIDEAGLQYLNGTTVLIADRTKATMVYNTGTLTITVKASITAQLDPGIYHYGLQDIDGAGLVAESYMGEFTITADIVRGTT